VPPARIDASIILVTALAEEHEAMRALIEDPRESFLGRGQNSVPCVVGTIPAADSGRHKVALVRTYMGTNLAASRTTEVLARLPGATHVIMAGIAAGLPNPRDVNEHVRLGDVVISNQIIQHDLVKVSSGRRPKHRPNPRPSSARLVAAAERLVEAQLRNERPWSPYTTSALEQLRWQRPAAGFDILADPDYPGGSVPPPSDPVRADREPRLFLAPVVSGNALMKDPRRRDELRDRFGARALEMEGAGIADASWLAERNHIVVRGICDYADLHKADQWHQYAAAAAAGVVRALLERLPASSPVPPAARGRARGQGNHGCHKRQEASPQVPLSDSSVMRYAGWVTERTATFTIPGLGVPLPIDRAWVTLQSLRDDTDRRKPKTLKEQLTAHYEWGRLSRQSADRPVQGLAEQHRRIVVGGAGAGKSTLCRREAHRLAAEGKRLLYVRLPSVARRYARGERIADALLAEATDGFSESTDLLRRELDPPDCLLGDGLDECGPERENLARALVAWGLARPNTHVTITTRPVGHDPGMFPGWVHQELLPFGIDDLQEHAVQLIRAACNGRTEAEAALRRFEASLAANRVISLAARSPLLLGFLVQLAIRDITPASRRAGLYEQVLALWARRGGRLDTPPISQVVSERLLNVIGWLVHRGFDSAQGTSRRELANGLANQLMPSTGNALLAALQEAEAYVQFWEECGVLEHLQVGGEDAYVFAHPTLGEYAAARYLMALDEASRQRALHLTRHEPRWREVILLAAGIGPAQFIVEPLLDAEDPQDPAGAECFLAAAALTEATHVPRQLTERVVQRVAARLSSPAPLVAFEASESAAGIAASAPDVVAASVRGLDTHSQDWTRLAAIRLQLEADSENVDLDALEALLQARLPSPHTLASE
jgi:nucleoside phosphorylase